MPKYLRTWMGSVTGSTAGRDDGHPERKFKVYDSIESLAAIDHGCCDESEFFELTPINRQDIVKKIDAVRQAYKRMLKTQKRQQKEAMFEKLKKELGK